jgi:SAM-dependent methyltransferase
MNEASKTRALWGDFERSLLSGRGIDIGCGPDPICPGVRQFDLANGDANEITKHVQEVFDFVFSAHCLEHMHDPPSALREWWQLVKPGGHMIVIVPDEDLYEQGYWPSLFNLDHKSTFTINKASSWSPRSFNLFSLAGALDGAELVSIQLHDTNYDRRQSSHSLRSHRIARLGVRIRNVMVKRLSKIGIAVRLDRLSRLLRLPIDQTTSDATAQIQLILRKRQTIRTGND